MYVTYNFRMISNLLAISEFTVKVIAASSGILLGIILALVLIFTKKNDKD